MPFLYFDCIVAAVVGSVVMAGIVVIVAAVIEDWRICVGSIYLKYFPHDTFVQLQLIVIVVAVCHQLSILF